MCAVNCGLRTSRRSNLSLPPWCHVLYVGCLLRDLFRLCLSSAPPRRRDRRVPFVFLRASFHSVQIAECSGLSEAATCVRSVHLVYVARNDVICTEQSTHESIDLEGILRISLR